MSYVGLKAWPMQVAQAEFVATVAEAIKTRSVLRLIDATLRLNSAGTPISALLQRLAFQASVLEEAGLVWKSIMDAVLERKAEDVELWAEQAKLAGENVEMELAFAQSLRQADACSQSLDIRLDSVLLCGMPPNI